MIYGESFYVICKQDESWINTPIRQAVCICVYISKLFTQ